MLTRNLPGFLGLLLAATLVGCHIPANSPFTGLAQMSPIATPHTNVLPPSTMLQHPGPGVEGPGPGVIMPASYEAAMSAAGIGIDGEGQPMIPPAPHFSDWFPRPRRHAGAMGYFNSRWF